MQKNVVRAGMAEDIDARIAGDLFGAVAPEDNFFLQVDYAHADLQAVEDGAVGLGILKSWHDGCAGMLLFVHRQKAWFNFKAAGAGSGVPGQNLGKTGFTRGWREWHFSGTPDGTRVPFAKASHRIYFRW